MSQSDEEQPHQCKYQISFFSGFQKSKKMIDEKSHEYQGNGILLGIGAKIKWRIG